ncbi:NAD(P)-dependent alcohol dehydrogenase [Amycolatopsis rubida]|uniref:alcohol dehydrogenase (NADP(+)) n=1 Tax=Amycolatopsis rubida TaxID=112413 RepID=A0ABX0C3N8_9PSEU|nr:MULTISPECIES: NAD(P)-dependent alcohol dehydrogenase [Amycolatopsis]NEC61214.1 NAD(P)-dependent alcohol dehydrogenase [Amycolatopsis rubida]
MTGPAAPFTTVTIERRDVGPTDVLLDIVCAGVCHTDVHHARAEFGHTHYPIVPGHEIAGVVREVGSEVTGLAAGDHVGIGCLVDSCRECALCRAGQESYCRDKVLTYNAIGRDGKVTLGGYSERVVADQRFLARIPDSLPLESAAPLLCAGITMYQPLRHWGAGPGKRVGILGFGGLGHIGTQISHALGAHTTVLELTEDRRGDAERLGADDYRTTGDLEALRDSFDLIVSTVPSAYDLSSHLDLLDFDGTFVNLGVPDEPLRIEPYAVLTNRRSLAGSMSGGMPETQEMLDFCAEHGIKAEVEVISAGELDSAYDRLSKGDVRYRFVLDTSTIAGS